MMRGRGRGREISPQKEIDCIEEQTVFGKTFRFRSRFNYRDVFALYLSRIPLNWVDLVSDLRFSFLKTPTHPP